MKTKIPQHKLHSDTVESPKNGRFFAVAQKG
jgi:hypothetical protein